MKEPPTIPATSPSRRKATPRASGEPQATRQETPQPSPYPAGYRLAREEISRRAYFLAEERKRNGLPPNPEQDWYDAERELLAGPSGNGSVS